VIASLRALKTWPMQRPGYNNFTRYYNNNKRNFDTFLSHIKNNKAKFRAEELDTYKQNVTVLNEQYNANVVPFDKILRDKQINPGTVQRTGDRNQQQLLTWFGEMNNKSNMLFTVAQRINALNK
jgi:hypothetical protein